MYAGLSVLFFFLILFLQQVAGWSALHAGLATLPTTLVMFFLSRHTGRLADRYGPRAFMGGGPLIAAAGLLLLQRVDANPDYVTEVLPGLLVFSLGLSLTVAPLTATVLADADEHNAGIASGVNNAIARVASLLGVAAIGAIVAAQFTTSLAQRRRRARAEPGRPGGAAPGPGADAREGRPARAAAGRAAGDRAGDGGRVGRGVPPRSSGSRPCSSRRAACSGSWASSTRGATSAPPSCAGGQLAGAPREAARPVAPAPVAAATARPAVARGP